MEKIKEVTICLHCGCSQEIVDNQIKILSQNDQIEIVAIDQNNTFYYLGQVNGMYLSGGDASTGTAYGDRNGFTLTFTGQENTPANTILSVSLDEQTATANAVLASVFTGVTVTG